MDKKGNIDTNIIELSKSFIDCLQKNMIHIETAIIFGSRSSDTANEYSDIDIALVSDDFSGIRFKDNERIIDITPNKYSIFDTHPYRPEEFNSDNPFVREILKTGYKIT
jgi:uncharacterized protein